MQFCLELHLADDTAVNKSSRRLCGGSTYQQYCVTPTGHALGERLQELRVKTLQICTQVFQFPAIKISGSENMCSGAEKG